MSPIYRFTVWIDAEDVLDAMTALDKAPGVIETDFEDIADA